MVVKTIVQVTILHPADETVDGNDLEHIIYQIDEGGWLGQSEIVSSEPVPTDKVREESLALGNDGTFFDQL